MKISTALLFALLAASTRILAQGSDTPPLELIDSNMQETPYTALVQIGTATLAKRTGTATEGYVSFLVKAKVLETFKGEARKEVEYYETHEAPWHGPQAGARVVVSLINRQDGALMVPDVGYVFPASAKVIERARRAGHAAAH